MMTAGFVGGGRVTRIVLGGWARAQVLPRDVVVHEISADAFALLKANVPSVRAGSLEEVAGADMLFLALHPPVIQTVLSQVKSLLRKETIVVSFAPKIPLSALSGAAGTRRVVRVIPNAPSLIGQGFNPVTYGDGVDDAAKTTVRSLLTALGEAPEIEEHNLEAYAILTGMGPTYFWFQLQALREVAVDLGLKQSECDRALRAMLSGTVATLLDAGMAPMAVMDLVPVKPLAQVEPTLESAYRTLLPALHAKIQAVIPLETASSAQQPT